MANEQFPIGCSIFRWNLRFVGGQPGNCNHSRAKALQKGLQGHLQGPKKTFAGSTSKLNAQGAKCQSCVCLKPCLFDGDDDIVGTVSILQNFAAVIVKFAHLLIFFQESFLRSFWFPFSLMLQRWPPTRVGPGWPRNSRPGWAALHPRPQFVFGQVVLSCFAAS